MKWQLLVLAAASLASAQDYNIFTPDQGPTDTLEVPEPTQTFQCYDSVVSTSYTMLLTFDYPEEMTAAVYIATHNNFYNGVVGLTRIDKPVSISYSPGAMGTQCYDTNSCPAGYDVLAYAATDPTESIGSASAPSASLQQVVYPIAQKVHTAYECVDASGYPVVSVIANYLVTANYSRTVPLGFAVNVFSMTDNSQPLVTGVRNGAVCTSCLPGTICCSLGHDSIDGSMSESQPTMLSFVLDVTQINSGETPTWFPTGSATQSSSSELLSGSATISSGSTGASGSKTAKATVAASPGIQSSASATHSAAKSGGYRAGVSIIFVALSATAALVAGVLFV